MVRLGRTIHHVDGAMMRGTCLVIRMPMLLRGFHGGPHARVARSAMRHGHARHPLNGKRDGDEPDDQEPEPDLHSAHSS